MSLHACASGKRRGAMRLVIIGAAAKQRALTELRIAWTRVP